MCVASLQTASESRNILDDATCPSMGLQLVLAPGTIASIRVHSMKGLYIGTSIAHHDHSTDCELGRRTRSVR